MWQKWPQACMVKNILGNLSWNSRDVGHLLQKWPQACAHLCNYFVIFLKNIFVFLKVKMLQGGKNQGLRPLLQLFCNIFKNIFVFLKVKMLHGGKSDHRLAPTSGCCRWRLPVSGRYVPSKTSYKSFPSKPDGTLRINIYFRTVPVSSRYVPSKT